MNDRIANLIVQQARQTGADPLTLLATAIVESGLNPNAVGDGGSSYGLFQMHVGGAGGASHQSARRYLDPQAAVENRARYFRGGSGGSFAASVQRPADPSGYARKVDGVIAQLRSGKHPASLALNGRSLNAPVSGGSAPQRQGGGEGGSSSRQAAIGLIFGNDPVFNMAAQQEWAPAANVPSAIRQGGGKGVPPRIAGEPAWKYLQRIGGSMFGLRNDPGDSQTTGGRHVANSHHYRGNAIDFGTARNSPQQLRQWDDFVNQNREALGVVEYLDEGDHRHTALARSIRGQKPHSGRFGGVK